MIATERDILEEEISLTECIIQLLSHTGSIYSYVRAGPSLTKHHSLGINILASYVEIIPFQFFFFLERISCVISAYMMFHQTGSHFQSQTNFKCN